MLVLKIVHATISMTIKFEDLDFGSISLDENHTKIFWFRKFHTKLWLSQNLCILFSIKLMVLLEIMMELNIQYYLPLKSMMPFMIRYLIGLKSDITYIFAKMKNDSDDDFP